MSICFSHSTIFPAKPCNPAVPGGCLIGAVGQPQATAIHVAHVTLITAVNATWNRLNGCKNAPNGGILIGKRKTQGLLGVDASFDRVFAGVSVVQDAPWFTVTSEDVK